jgi:hypothetical protein
MDPIRFNCRHCKTRLKASAKLLGRYINCPHCRQNTPIPDADEDGGTYGVAAATVGSAAERPVLPERTNGPADDDWRTRGHASLPVVLRDALDEARGLARSRNWRAALSLLLRLFRNAGDAALTNSNYPVRKPVSFCLVHWALDDLEAIAQSARLSRPMRQLARIAADRRKWGGTFDMRECPLCERNPQRRNVNKVRTAVGWAHLCCAAPTQSDLELIDEVAAIRLRLAFARALDDQNEDALKAIGALPEWFRMLAPDNQASWDKEGANETRWGELLADMIAVPVPE